MEQKLESASNSIANRAAALQSVAFSTGSVLGLIIGGFLGEQFGFRPACDILLVYVSISTALVLAAS